MWLDYLKSHTVKDMVRLGILSAEFKNKFVNGKSDETLARTLYDVLLARAGDAGGLDHWGKEVGLFGLENVVDRLLASSEYINTFGDDAVPGGGRAGCVSTVQQTTVIPTKTPTSSPTKTPTSSPTGHEWHLVEQFYCRVLQRPPESEQAILRRLRYLKSHTVKDLVRRGVLGDEFKIKFVNGKSDETLARTLYDVMLARAGDAVGLDSWAEQIGVSGWDSAVNSILASGEYNDNFGDDAVPGGGRAGCGIDVSKFP
jgi:hypothetical protein